MKPYLYTPHNCYKWLLTLGLSHEVAAVLTSDRALFEYFIECIS